MNDSLKKHINQNRKEFDLKEPPKRMWDNIKNTLPNVEEKKEQPNKMIQNENKKKNYTLFYGIAASVLVIIITYFGFNALTHKQIGLSSKIVKIDRVKPSDEVEQIANESIQSKELKYIENLAPSETKHESDLAFHSTSENNQTSVHHLAFQLIEDSLSTSNRLKGILQLKEVKNITEKELKLLKNISLTDVNSIVRLNALEVLTHNLKKDEMAEELTTLFLKQDDAMVQLELINMIKTIHPTMENKDLINKLQEIILDAKSSSFLKDEAYVVLLQKNML